MQYIPCMLMTICTAEAKYLTCFISGLPLSHIAMDYTVFHCANVLWPLTKHTVSCEATVQTCDLLIIQQAIQYVNV